MPHKDQEARRAYHAKYRLDHPEKWDYASKKDAINKRRRERLKAKRAGIPSRRVTHGKTHTVAYALWAGAKKRAANRGLPFALTVHDIPEVPAFCPVLGIRIEQGASGRAVDSSPSLDRLRPALGYVAGNVRVVSWRANRLRNDASAEELRILADDAQRLAEEAAKQAAMPRNLDLFEEVGT